MHFILGRTFMSNSVCGIEKTQFSPIFVTLGTRSRIQVFTTARQSRLPLGKTNQISENSTFFPKKFTFFIFFLFYRFVEHLVETDLLSEIPCGGFCRKGEMVWKRAVLDLKGWENDKKWPLKCRNWFKSGLTLNQFIQRMRNITSATLI